MTSHMCRMGVVLVIYKGEVVWYMDVEKGR